MCALARNGRTAPLKKRDRIFRSGLSCTNGHPMGRGEVAAHVPLPLRAEWAGWAEQGRCLSYPFEEERFYPPFTIFGCIYMRHNYHVCQITEQPDFRGSPEIG